MGFQRLWDVSCVESPREEGVRDGQTGGAGDTGSQGRESRERAGPELLLPREGFPDLPLT